jgi:DNA-binding GntR family transcriptional regulator
VAEIRVEDVDRLFPIVKCLDVLTLETAFPFMDPDGVAVMRAAYRKQEEALARGDHRAVAKAGVTFHDAYLLRSNNPELIDLNQKMQAKARRLMNFFHESFRSEPALALEGHKPLIQAVADGRLDDAKAVLSRHWEFVARLVRKAAIEAAGHD